MQKGRNAITLVVAVLGPMLAALFFSEKLQQAFPSLPPHMYFPLALVGIAYIGLIVVSIPAFRMSMGIQTLVFLGLLGTGAYAGHTWKAVWWAAALGGMATLIPIVIISSILGMIGRKRAKTTTQSTQTQPTNPTFAGKLAFQPGDGSDGGQLDMTTASNEMTRSRQALEQTLTRADAFQPLSERQQLLDAGKTLGWHAIPTFARLLAEKFGPDVVAAVFQEDASTEESTEGEPRQGRRRQRRAHGNQMRRHFNDSWQRHNK